jgi:hypothetical protein
MRNKRYILSFLLFISIIMLVVPVIPHHHHPGNDSCCNDGCMTRLNSPTPSVQADHSPHYLFTAILFTDLIIENLFKPQERRIKNYYAYRESLHSTVINCAFGLRAPPYPVV